MNKTDLKQRKERSKENHKHWTKKPIGSGFYLVRGKHFTHKFKCTLVMVDAEENKAFLNAKHMGFYLDKMYYTEFLGPFLDAVELIEAQQTATDNNDCHGPKRRRYSRKRYAM